MEEARDVVKKELEKLQNALDRRDELARERESLELIMEATTVCSKSGTVVGGVWDVRGRRRRKEKEE